MSYRRVVLTAGFAMFSMFFGSGNLVFPLLLGRSILDMSLFGTLGFILTAVLVPCLGLMGIVLYEGNAQSYFGRLGTVPAYIIIGVILSLMGPFGVVPRCITVAYGGLHVLYPTLSFPLFSFLFCLIITLLIWQSHRVVDIIGVILTPFKLGGLSFLMLVGLYNAPPADSSSFSALQATLKGMFLGYHTMDLLAAFFFSSTVIQYLRQNMSPEDQISKLFNLSFKSCLIGALLLCIAYVGFIALGAAYGTSVAAVEPEALLAIITQRALGDLALPIVSFTMVIACLTTSVILTVLFVQFIQKDVLVGRISEKQAILLTISATFAMSLLGFQDIFEMLGTLLSIGYPSLIVLAIMNIVSKLTDRMWSNWPFWTILGCSAAYELYTQIMTRGLLSF